MSGKRWLYDPLLAGAIAVLGWLAWSASYSIRLASAGVSPAEPVSSLGEWLLRVIAPVGGPVGVWVALCVAINWLTKRTGGWETAVAAGAVALVMVGPVALHQVWIVSEQDGWRGLAALGALMLLALPVAAFALTLIASFIISAAQRFIGPGRST